MSSGPPIVVPGRAEACAEFLGRSIPGASHINHMPSHTWNEVGRWGDSVRANTVSGDQRLETVSKGRLELRAISGDIGVGIRRGSRLYVDANTLSGSTSSDLELADVPHQEGEGETPLVELFAKTVSGDVRIERS